MRKVTAEELATLENPDLSICKIDSERKNTKRNRRSI